ncbi:hypothetical protein D1007_48076 [Hordeum vulgare]|nr:hypothetical protein D1007_48076 [Hordeum vulgare]
MSEIERDKLSLQEVKGFLQDHIQLKESMKLYFLLPGKELVNGLVFLNDDSGCVKMADYICVGGVADVSVEYHGEEDNDIKSGSDYEDEIIEESGDEPDAVIIVVEPAESDTDVLIPDETGVITGRLCSPMKQRKVSSCEAEMPAIERPFSQVLNPAQVASDSASETLAKHVDKDNSDSNSDSNNEYIGHNDDSGEDSEVVELRRHARKFKRRMRDTRRWIGRDAIGLVPTDLIANLVEQIEREEMDWNYDSSDEDYIYDEDSYGHIKKRKTTFPRYTPKSEVPHFALTMVLEARTSCAKL